MTEENGLEIPDDINAVSTSFDGRRGGVVVVEWERGMCAEGIPHQLRREGGGPGSRAIEGGVSNERRNQIMSLRHRPFFSLMTLKTEAGIERRHRDWRNPCDTEYTSTSISFRFDCEYVSRRSWRPMMRRYAPIARDSGDKSVPGTANKRGHAFFDHMCLLPRVHEGRAPRISHQYKDRELTDQQ